MPRWARSTFDHPGSYADPEADIGATATAHWALWLDEVVTAVARAGLRVDRLVEHLSAEVNHLACSCREDGRWPLTVDGRDVPLLSALEGSKAAG